MGTIDVEQGRTAVILLAGGLGTRLKVITGDTPKPLISILGRPFIEYQIDHLRSMMFEHFFVTAAYRIDLVKAAIEDYRKRTNCHISVLEEQTAAGTFGAIIQADLTVPKHFDRFLVVNADTLIDADYRKLIYQNAVWDLVVTAVELSESSRYGTLQADKEGRLVSFEEKSFSGAGAINAGVYMFRRRVVRETGFRTPASIENDFIPHALEKLNIGLENFGPVPFIDIGTPESFAQAAEFSVIRRLNAQTSGI